MDNIREYVSEPAYFIEQGGFPATEAVRLTLKRIVAWATTYDAAPLEKPELVREGHVPENAAARLALIDDLIAWGAEHSGDEGLRGGRVGAGIVLRRDENLLFDGHDGLPASLFVTPDEFALLQEAWAGAGLPADLFYPESEAKQGSEPVQLAGHTVLVPRTYSPRQWANRRMPEDALAASQELGDPHVERGEFLDACARFVDAATVRRTRIQEEGAPGADDTAQELADAIRQVQRVRLRELSSGAPLSKE